MRRIGFLITVLLFVLLIFASAAVAESKYSIDKTDLNKGAFSINYSIENGKKVKVMLQKDGTTLYYNLLGKSGIETFPVQLGNGTYTIAVLENTTGNQYRAVLKDTINVSMNNSLDVFLQSIQIIKWEKENEAVRKAKELTADIQSDEEKVKVIYEYIVKNYRYDFSKIDGLSYDYLPNIDSTLKSKSGICYDFSALFASMLRSVGVPTKLVKGYGEKIQGYHAWNEVYLNNKWITVDTSVDSQFAASNQQYSMYKDNSIYEKVSEF